MEDHKRVDRKGPLERHGEEVIRAYRRAVKDALRKHKREGNSVVVQRDGKIAILQPDEIEIEIDID